MKKGPIIFALLIVIIIAAAVFLKPIIFDRGMRSTSNASSATETIRIDGDDYGGYWFWTSPKMRKMLPRAGLTISFNDDKGAYVDRLERFKNKECDAIMLPIAQYLEHGAKHKFPGVMVMAIAESEGADALVGFEDVLPTGKINELNNPELKIVYTGQSPTSFLIDLVVSDFGMDRLQSDNGWRQEVSGCEEVFKIAKKAMKDRSLGDVFGLWEPYVTKAISELGMKPVWGSDQFKGYTIDVLVVHRSYLKKHPDNVEKLLKTYFRVLDSYGSDKEKMIDEMKKSMHLKKDAVESMIDKINWFDLMENCNSLFGVQLSAGAQTNDAIYSSIIQCGNVLSSVGKFDNNDLQDPYLIVNSDFIEGIGKNNAQSLGSGLSVKTVFAKLDDKEWKKLEDFGAMRIQPITFQSGTSVLDQNGEKVVDKVAGLLNNNYSSYRVAIRGHTSSGDEIENMKLSVERAEIVVQRLIAVHGMNADRFHAEGYGATKPPERKEKESTHAFRHRMQRVEFVLLKSNNL